jgi:hypothetical protein
MTDTFRALCAELLSEIQALRRAVADEVGCSSPEASVMARARAALAQPEPQGPTDAEIAECLIDAGVDTMEGESDGTGRTYWEGWHDQVMAGVRAILARWGRPAIGPVPGVEGADG